MSEEIKDRVIAELTRQRDVLLAAVNAALEHPDCNVRPKMAAALVDAAPQRIECCASVMIRFWRLLEIGEVLSPGDEFLDQAYAWRLWPAEFCTGSFTGGERITRRFTSVPEGTIAMKWRPLMDCNTLSETE